MEDDTIATTVPVETISDIAKEVKQDSHDVEINNKKDEEDNTLEGEFIKVEKESNSTHLPSADLVEAQAKSNSSMNLKELSKPCSPST
ncbi:unnamed protein product [Rhodiola kirilowii]